MTSTGDEKAIAKIKKKMEKEGSQSHIMIKVPRRDVIASSEHSKQVYVDLGTDEEFLKLAKIVLTRLKKGLEENEDNSDRNRSTADEKADR